MVSNEYDRPGSEAQKTPLLNRFKNGSLKFYEKWAPTILASTGMITTSLGTFGIGRSFESANYLDTAAFGITALLWGSLTIRQLIKHNRQYNAYQEHAVILQNELDKIHHLKRLPRGKIHPHYPV